MKTESEDSVPIEGSGPGKKKKATINELKVICGRVQVPTYDYSEILPGLILGGVTTVKQTKILKSLGVTHILNAAYDSTGKGNFIYVQTNEEYFQIRKFNVVYKGIRAPDTMRFRITKHFDEAADFIHEGLSSGGVVYVHCYMGISRSAMFVMVYLMTKRNMSAIEACKFVRSKREIFPNDGFLQQLIDWEDVLEERRKNGSSAQIESQLLSN